MLNAGLCDIADAFIEPSGQTSEFRANHRLTGHYSKMGLRPGCPQTDRNRSAFKQTDRNS